MSRALMANPEQQGLKLDPVGFGAAPGVQALMANPEQQGLKHFSPHSMSMKSIEP